ncbi:AMP-binding protein [Janibacter corallicola]|uniref:AMP-binding protein n=1 Tax=Janibacter corallicola TaxID=415212 RepID=UPI00082E4796|nr:AMP-binding protein [Janibacter corallicola]
MDAATETYRTARDQLLDLRGEPDRARETFSFPEFGGRFNWAIDWFDAIARGTERPALIVREEDGSSQEISFDQMAARSDRVAAWLAGRGVAKGDPVVLMLGNQVELWETMLGLMKLGAIIVPTTTAVGGSDLQDRISRSGARFVIANAADAPTFADVSGDYGRISVGPAEGWSDLREAQDRDVPPAEHPGTAPSDPLLYYFTSGTTSRPKLVEHTQVSYPVGHMSTMYWIGLRPGDVHLNISSPGWAKHAWSCFFAPWIAEATIFIYNYSRFDPPSLLEQIRERSVTTFCAPPTVWRMLINADLSAGPGTLREVVGAGEPLNPEVIDKVRELWGMELRDGYGQTETTASVGNPPGSELHPGSMGKPLPGVPVVLVEPVSGQRVDGVGEGEVCIDLTNAPMPLMTGYLGDPERNDEAMAGGVYHTGDVAERDENGYITYIGRTDDVFKSSDYKVSPFEVESALIEHPAVAEAAVVPAPDEVRLTVPKAYVMLAPGYEPSEETAKEILRHARQSLSPWLRVRRLEFAELPKTISGKIRRVELREREEGLAAGRGDVASYGDGTEWRDDMFPEIKG